MTRRCWPLSVFFIDEEPGMEMKNQIGTNNKGRSDIAIQLNGPAIRLGSGVFDADNGPLNISTDINDNLRRAQN